MEIRYKIMLYIAIAVFAVLFILVFVPFPKSKGKFKNSKKVANAFYVREERFFKRKMAAYKVITFTLVMTCCISIALSTFMISRPYRTETVIEEKYTRDIFLCIDISSSVDSLNATLIDELKNIVDEMQGERFGLIIFNTSPVLLVPLTDDYEYILQELDAIQVELERRWNNSFVYDDDYITSGTLVGSEMRGSSLIGDGLASAVFDFQELEENEERTKLVIFSTDNELNGTPFITLEQASDLCIQHNVQVYGIGTQEMNKKSRIEMENAVKATGGKFYEYGMSGSCQSIVGDIQRETKSFINQEPVVKEVELAKAPFVVLLTFVTVMMVMGKLAKY
ncbi:MAG: VWA domain-containing protein [Clostridiales bacterium]|nr:VWA domain-containing protein [Clostridiales bacterium]